MGEDKKSTTATAERQVALQARPPVYISWARHQQSCEIKSLYPNSHQLRPVQKIKTHFYLNLMENDPDHNPDFPKIYHDNCNFIPAENL